MSQIRRQPVGGPTSKHPSRNCTTKYSPALCFQRLCCVCCYVCVTTLVVLVCQPVGLSSCRSSFCNTDIHIQQTTSQLHTTNDHAAQTSHSFEIGCFMCLAVGGAAYWVGGGSRPNFHGKSYFDCFCRLSMRALGRPDRLTSTVPRAALIFA